jgi:hypothetical protein
MGIAWDTNKNGKSWGEFVYIQWEIEISKAARCIRMYQI